MYKVTNLLFKNTITLAVVGGGMICSSQVNAATLLQVDLSVVNQVTITSTDGASSATVSGGDFTGVYLDGFYSSVGGSLNESLVSGDLTNFLNPPDNAPVLFRGGSGNDLGLNIFSFSSDSTIDFTDGVQAFTGQGTWTMPADDYADMLVGPTSGDLYFPADSQEDVAGATLIGEWERSSAEPIPEPVTILGTTVAFGLGSLMKRKKSQAK